jgi:hypothetical protein
MSKEIKITVEEGVKELIIRNGEASKIHVPNGIEIGKLTIDAVREYLSKKGVDPNEIQNSYIWYSNEERFIQLEYAYRIENRDSIHGQLTLHPDLEKFEINKAKQYSTHQLAQFIRMNKHFFESKDVALKLINELMNFKAKVDKEIEASDDKKANVKMMLVQKVTSNIPTEFTLNLPIFIGTKPVPVAVEIDIDAMDLSCNLISPALKELIDTESTAIIDTELQAVRLLYPELRIFQK